MYDDRLAEFNKNREKVLKAHLGRDKTYLAKRRKGRARVVLGALQIAFGTLAVLAVLKTLMLATNSPAEYARIIAPAVQGLDANHPVAKALLPDSLTMTVAEALRPMLAEAMGAEMAFGPPMPPEMINPAVTPES